MKVVVTYDIVGTHLGDLVAAAPGADIRVVGTADEARDAVRDADAILGNRFLAKSLPHAARLRWVQSNSTGVDRILASGDLPANAVLTCVRGVYDAEIAEHALALTLSLVRGLHTARDRQQRRVWERPPLRSIARMRALVLGWGGVGRTVARTLAALGAHVEGVRRTQRDGDATGLLVHGARWRDALPRTDLLVVALPLTAATRGVVGAAEIGALARRALVVAVGRGETLDEDALLAGIRSGALGGAALDVFAEEPLPSSSPLWSEPNVIVSPHTARGAEGPPFRWEPLFAENLRRFAAGEPLLHVVDRGAGY